MFYKWLEMYREATHKSDFLMNPEGSHSPSVRLCIYQESNALQQLHYSKADGLLKAMNAIIEVSILFSFILM